jgi:hypothetical protein
MATRSVDLVIELRNAARIGTNGERGSLDWRELLERAAAEIVRLRAELVVIDDESTTGPLIDVRDEQSSRG